MTWGHGVNVPSPAGWGQEWDYVDCVLGGQPAEALPRVLWRQFGSAWARVGDTEPSPPRDCDPVLLGRGVLRGTPTPDCLLHHQRLFPWQVASVHPHFPKSRYWPPSPTHTVFLPGMGGGRIWTLQVHSCPSTGATQKESLGWEPALEDSLLPRLGGGEWRTKKPEGSPKGLHIELGTRHPRHCQRLRTAKGRAPGAWAHWTNRHVLAGSRKER